MEGFGIRYLDQIIEGLEGAARRLRIECSCYRTEAAGLISLAISVVVFFPCCTPAQDTLSGVAIIVSSYLLWVMIMTYAMADLRSWDT